MSAGDFIPFMPLLQSFVGALAAFGVAAFTVWVTNRHAHNREEKQAKRAKNFERQKVLREKLEALIDSVELAHREATFANMRVHSLASALERSRIADAPKIKDSSAYAEIRNASVLADLYFRNMVDFVDAYLAHLISLEGFVNSEARSLLEDHAKWRDGPGTDFQERFLAHAEELIKLRRKMINEARRLIDSDFDLQD